MSKEDLDRTKRLIGKLETIPLSEWNIEGEFCDRFVTVRHNKKIEVFVRYYGADNEKYYISIDHDYYSGLDLDRETNNRLGILYKRIELYREKKSKQDRINVLESLIDNFDR